MTAAPPHSDKGKFPRGSAVLSANKSVGLSADNPPESDDSQPAELGSAQVARRGVGFTCDLFLTPDRLERKPSSSPLHLAKQALIQAANVTLLAGSSGLFARCASQYPARPMLSLAL